MRGIGQGLVWVAVAVFAAGTALVLHHSPAPAAVSTTRALRLPAQRTLVLGPGSSFAVDEYSTETGKQQLTVNDEHGSAQVWAYDPGTFDARSLVRGQQVRFGGHDGWFARDPVPTLFWRSPLGDWLAASGSVTQESLFGLARAVRLSTPTPVVGPVGLTWLPTGLTLTFARIGNGTSSEIFTARGRRSYDLRMSVYAVTSNDWTNGTLGWGAPSMAVAGHPAWYSMDPDGHSQVLLEAGSCGLRLQVSDHSRIPLSIIEQMLTGATIAGCDDDAGGWPPILS
jgi:hypothetical protein